MCSKEVAGTTGLTRFYALSPELLDKRLDARVAVGLLGERNLIDAQIRDSPDLIAIRLDRITATADGRNVILERAMIHLVSKRDADLGYESLPFYREDSFADRPFDAEVFDDTDRIRKGHILD